MLTQSIVQTDGQKYVGQRDPPGQLTTYIPAGDTWKESYRAVTFRNFPQDTPVSPRNLANSGFFYTGYRDRVKCFSCGSTVENWIVGDDPEEKRWHREDCEFARGLDTANEPILGIFKRYLASSPVLTRNYASTSRQANGTSMQINNVGAARRNITGRNLTQATNALRNRTNSSPPQSVAPSPLDVDYPCLHPVNPHMRSSVARLETFKPTSTVRWPRERLRAGINEITNAGFFYLGERDKVKCWYCNGGLENWDYEDDPWTEHAKWFPSCEFLLQQKGPAFVQNVVDQFPNVNRPTPTVRVVRRSSNSPSSPPTSNNSNQYQIQCIERVVENAMGSEIYVAQARDMEFCEDDVKAFLPIKHRSYGGRLIESTEECFDALTNYQQQQQQRKQQQQQRTSPPHHNSTSVQSISLTPRPWSSASEEDSNSAMLFELRSMEKSRLCKICYKQPSNVVLIPCGHLVCCKSCSNENLRRCPVCHRGIQEKIKVLRS